jgi:hypothetical protein
LQIVQRLFNGLAIAKLMCCGQVTRAKQRCLPVASSLAGLAEIACDLSGGAGAGQFVGARHPHLREDFA